MRDSLRRRSLLASGAAALLGGCLARGNSPSDQDDAGDSEPEFEVVEEIVDEEQLFEISTVGRWTSIEDLRVLDDEQLRTIEPSRARWVQPTVRVKHLGEYTGEILAKPAISDVEAVALETGERFEPVEWPHSGVEFDDIREDRIMLQRSRSEWETGSSTDVAPVFDAPAGELALDVGAIVEQESPPLLQ